MTPNEVAEAARLKGEQNPALAAAMRNVWVAVYIEIEAAVDQINTPNRGYLLQTRTRAARLEFLTAFLEDADPAVCVARARKAGGLDT